MRNTWMTAALAALALLAATDVPSATASTTAPTLPPGCTGPAGGTVAGDINGDGHGDIVTTEYGRTRLRGGIHVLYGTPTGLTADPAGTAPGDQFLTQDSLGFDSTGAKHRGEDADEWGAALAVADFDGDGCADVAVGAPGEDAAAGAVTVLYGTPAGLSTTGTALLTQASRKVPDTPEPNDRFGSALAAGDLDGDGIADLAVGAPGESIDRAFQAGTATVLYGAAGGLSTGERSLAVRQGSAPLGGGPETDDAFGAALAIADVTGAGRSALIVGSPGENDHGAVVVIPTGPDGFTTPVRAFTRDTKGVPGTAARSDRFGARLVAGDFNADRRADLAVGVPGLDNGRGGVTVLYARGSTGLSGTGAVHLNQGSRGVEGDGHPGDGFGAALAAGRVTSGMHADLIVGTPFADVSTAAGAVPDAGAVHVFPGSDAGLRLDRTRYLHQGVTGVSGDPGTGDRFGLSVTTRQIRGRAQEHLVVGVPAEGTTGTFTQRAGAFEVLGASKAGPTGIGSVGWTLSSPGVQGDPAPGVFLGYALG
ncbi:MAG: FG-GAP repeat protein [Sporichthyaceae bacterium]